MPNTVKTENTYKVPGLSAGDKPLTIAVREIDGIYWRYTVTYDNATVMTGDDLGITGRSTIDYAACGLADHLAAIGEGAVDAGHLTPEQVGFCEDNAPRLRAWIRQL